MKRTITCRNNITKAIAKIYCDESKFIIDLDNMTYTVAVDSINGSYLLISILNKLSEIWKCKNTDIMIVKIENDKEQDVKFEATCNEQHPITISALEKIRYSAIHFILRSDDPDIDGKPMILTGSFHGEIFESVKKLGIKYDESNYIKGFITNRLRFVNQVDARKIAKVADQILPEYLDKSDTDELFSYELKKYEVINES